MVVFLLIFLELIRTLRTASQEFCQIRDLPSKFYCFLHTSGLILIFSPFSSMPTIYSWKGWITGPYTWHSRRLSQNVLTIIVAVFLDCILSSFLSEWIMNLLFHFQVHFNLSVFIFKSVYTSIWCYESLVCYHSSRCCFMISPFISLSWCFPVLF